MCRLLIAASGTGGHIFPALTIAKALPKSWIITWLGVPDRLESKLIPQSFPFFFVHAGGLQGNGFRRIYKLFQLVRATFFVMYLIRKKDIDIVFTTGGYIAAPAILGAKLCGKKVVLHESNALPGRVTRLLGRLCDIVALGFVSSAKYLPACKTTFTGTPVRKSFTSPQILPNWVPDGSGPLIVVVGGSQGAVGLNRMVVPTFPLLLAKGCRIVHLTGKHDDAKKLSHSNLVTKTFTDEIASLIQNADLVISRSGAGALSEFAVCGIPAVLIPYPYASDKHQDFNAVSFAERGAALIVHQHGPNEPALGNALDRLLKSRIQSNLKQVDFLSEMQLEMKKIAVKNADQKIVSILFEISS